MVKRFMVLLLSVFVICVSTACGNNQDSIVGTWIVAEYKLNDETFLPDDIDELLGEMSSEYNKNSLIFTATGNVKLIRPDFKGSTTEMNLAYTVQDEQIEVYNPDDTSDFQLLQYQDGVISIEISSGLTALFKKK